MKIEVVAAINEQESEELVKHISQLLNSGGIYFTISVNQSKVYGAKQ